MQMFINSFKVNTDFRPLIKHLNYMTTWPLSQCSTLVRSLL